MPADPNTIAAATDGINQVANTISTNDMNRRTQRFAREMYDKQRAHALQDWNTQNAYNSPAAQMQRLKDAGLNPNLVYGNGADATASQMPRQADTPSWNPDTPRINYSAQNALSNYYDTQFRQAQTNNLAVQKTLMEQQAINTAAQTAATLAGTAKTKVETSTLSELQSTTIAAARANLQKILSDTKYTQDENRRKEELQPTTVKQAVNNEIQQRLTQSKTVAETRSIMQGIENMRKEGALKQIEIDIRKTGGNPNDPYWQKKIIQLVEEFIKPSSNNNKSNQRGVLGPWSKDVPKWMKEIEKFSPY